MKRGLLFSALAFVTSALFGVEPVASWNGFNTTTSGNYTVTLPTDATKDDETGTVTLNSSTPLTVTRSSSATSSGITILAQIEDAPTTGDIRLAEFNVPGASVWIGLSSSGTTLKQAYSSSAGGSLTESYGTATWTPATKQWVAFAYLHNDGTYTFLDGVQKIGNQSLRWSGKSISLDTIHLGRSASGMKVHQLYIYTSKLSATEVASEIARATSPNNSATLSAGETTWDAISWDKSPEPTADYNITFTLSGDTTLTDVPETAFGKLFFLGSGKVNLSGTTLNVSALTVGSNITALDTSALTVAESASVTIPDTCTWTLK